MQAIKPHSESPGYLYTDQRTGGSSALNHLNLLDAQTILNL